MVVQPREAYEAQIVRNQYGFELGSIAWWVAIPIAAREIAHSSGADISLLVTSMSIAGAVFGIPLSKLITRMGLAGLWSIGITRVTVVAVTIGALVGFPDLSFWVMLVASVVMGGVEVSYAMSQQVLVSSLVDKSRLTRMNGRITFAQSLSQVVGASGMGVLLDRISPLFGFVFDAVLNIFGLKAAWKLKSAECKWDQTVETSADSSWPERSGIVAIRTRHFSSLLAATLVMRLFLSMSVAVQSAYMATDLRATATQLGLAFALGSVGGVLAGAAVTRWGSTVQLRWLLFGGISLVAGPQLLILFAFEGWGVLMVGIANMLSGVGASLFAIASVTLRQKVLTTAEVGAVSGVFASLGGAVGIVGSVLGTASAYVMPLRGVLVIATVGLFAPPLLLLAGRSGRLLRS